MENVTVEIALLFDDGTWNTCLWSIPMEPNEKVNQETVIKFWEDKASKSRMYRKVVMVALYNNAPDIDDPREPDFP
jgi:hypothetical protein